VSYLDGGARNIRVILALGRVTFACQIWNKGYIGSGPCDIRVSDMDGDARDIRVILVRARVTLHLCSWGYRLSRERAMVLKSLQ
jgi:hypothetical protein